MAAVKLQSSLPYSKPLAMRPSLFLTSATLFLLSTSLDAADAISANQAIDHPVVLPVSVIDYLTKEIDTTYAECEQEGLIVSKAFEARTVELSSSVKAFVVKPRSRCFCTKDECPMWVFDASNQKAKVLFESPMAGLLTFSDNKTRGFPDIKVSGGLLSHGLSSHGYEVRYAWDGAEYQEIYNHVWIWNPDRQCKEAEIEELKDGKWVKTSKACLNV
ncbi:MAG: hypothetical protein ACAH08_05060 [Methylophilus sp.]|uniref:hypothetical protein n=1 Tax=Methylophilus sp. TaxID=29541 RepID=UPI002CF1E02A|nr:hypothetical protein [Methylophilus sp.]HSH85612.1 hypothetical protein [Methylophilus sp.]